MSACVRDSWAGSGVESGFCDGCLISGCLRSPPPTLSCHSNAHALLPIERRPFRMKHALTCSIVETQHRRSKATISGQEAAILVQSVSAALRRCVSQWPSDETRVALKWLTDWLCQQRGGKSLTAVSPLDVW